MKLPLLGAIAAATLTIATTTMASESNAQNSVSGAPDSTVMTQTKKPAVEKKQHKQVQSDESKRGRPVEKTSSTAN